MEEIPERHWYFDTSTRRLVYRMSQQDSTPQAPVEFEVKVAFEDRNNNGAFEPGTDELYGIRLHRFAGVDWLEGVVRQ